MLPLRDAWYASHVRTRSSVGACHRGTWPGLHESPTAHAYFLFVSCFSNMICHRCLRLPDVVSTLRRAWQCCARQCCASAPRPWRLCVCNRTYHAIVTQHSAQPPSQCHQLSAPPIQRPVRAVAARILAEPRAARGYGEGEGGRNPSLIWPLARHLALDTFVFAGQDFVSVLK